MNNEEQKFVCNSEFAIKNALELTKIAIENGFIKSIGNPEYDAMQVAIFLENVYKSLISKEPSKLTIIETF